MNRPDGIDPEWFERRMRRVLRPKGVRWVEKHPNSKPDPRWQTVWSPEIAAFNRRMQLAGFILMALFFIALVFGDLSELWFRLDSWFR